ncbi:MAG: ribose 5-phosphate isomerase B [Holosporaceae bacterium]|jgi:ribose 5-phosphate isomerase B|nr:ribose 5-phosphate isomerase B [Holosporaceae bacterium]
MKVFIASDHAGFLLKEYLKPQVDMVDLGTDGPISCDYPVFAKKLISHVAEDEKNRGVLICSTGIGMSIAANRNRKIRAALCCNEKMAEMSRCHNDANVIIFGASIIEDINALECLRIFLKTEFEKGRHSRRLALI